MNHLYFGDNLDVLKQFHRQHPEGFSDLIYIDPPFNSKRNYNALYNCSFSIPFFAKVEVIQHIKIKYRPVLNT